MTKVRQENNHFGIYKCKRREKREREVCANLMRISRQRHILAENGMCGTQKEARKIIRERARREAVKEEEERWRERNSIGVILNSCGGTSYVRVRKSTRA
jgi:hypothetical protein